MKYALLLSATLLSLLFIPAQAISIPKYQSYGFDHYEDLSERWEEIKTVLPHAVRVPSAEGRGNHLWQTPVITADSLIPNKDGQGYVLPLVVTPPAGKRLAMAVCISSDPGCLPAGLLSPDGEEIKTARRLSNAPAWLEDLQWPPANHFGGFWIPSRDLVPGREHVLVFACRPGAPANITICVTFLPTEPESFSDEWQTVATYLGLKPMTGERMAETGGYRSAKIVSAFPALAMKNSTTPISLKVLVPGVLSLNSKDPDEPWLERSNMAVEATEPRRPYADHIEFASDRDSCPTRDEVVRLAGEPLLSVSLDDLQRHQEDRIRKTLPAPEFSTPEFPSKGIRVEYYDVLAVLTTDDTPSKVVGTWIVGDFTGGGKLSGHQTFLLPGTQVRAFLIDGKCVGLVEAFAKEDYERLMDSDPPAGKYLEKTPGGETFATFEHDGQSHWKVTGFYPDGKPRFQYRVNNGRLGGDVEMWYFGGKKMERKPD